MSTADRRREYEEYRRSLLGGNGSADERRTTNQEENNRRNEYENYRMELLGSDRSNEVDENFITQYLTDASNYLTRANQDYNSLSYATASDVYDYQYNMGSDLTSRSGAIYNFLMKNKESLNPSDYSSLMAKIKEVNEAVRGYEGAFRDAKKYYSQWDTEEDYDTAVRHHGWLEQYSKKSGAEISDILNSMEDGEEKEWLKEYFRSSEDTESRQRRQDWWEESSKTIASLEKINDEYAKLMQKGIRESSGSMYSDGGRYSAGYNSRDPYGQRTSETQQTGNSSSYGKEAAEFLKANGFESIADLRSAIERLKAERNQYARGEGGFTGKTLDDYHLKYMGDQAFLDASGQRDYNNSTVQDLMLYDDLNNLENWTLMDDGRYLGADGRVITEENGNYYHPATELATVNDKLGLFLNATEEEKQLATESSMGTWRDIYAEGSTKHWDLLKEDEVTLYYGIRNTQGEAAANKFLMDMQRTLDQRAAYDYIEADAARYDEANDFGKFMLNLATVGKQLEGNIFGFVEDAAATIRGEEINPYSAAHGGMHFTQTVRSKTAEDLDNWAGTNPVFSLSDAYQSGMSVLDSLAAIGIGGNFGGTLLAMGAAENEAYRLYQQGASKEQIVAGAALAGAAEMIFESISIGNLDAIKNVKSPKTLAQAFKTILIQGGVEASEEVMTEIANTLTNGIVMGTQSDFFQLAEEKGGFGAALGQVGLNTLKAALGGLLSGGISGLIVGGASYVGNLKNFAKTGGEIIERGGVDSLKSAADIVSGGKGSVAKQAGKVKSDSTSLANKINVGRLSQEVNEVTFNKIRNAMESAAEAQLTELGETGNVKQIAKLAAKRAVGIELSREEKHKLANSQYGARVANELRDNNAEKGAQRPQKAAKYKPLTERIDTDSLYGVSESGKAVIRATGEEIDTNNLEVKTVGDGKMTFQIGDRKVSAGEIDWADDNQSFLVSAVSNIENITPADATSIMRDVVDMSKPLGLQLNAIDEAFTYGYHDYSVEDLKAGEFAEDLTDKQLMRAYELGKAARRDSDVAADAPIVKMRTAAEAKLTAEQKTAQQKARIESNDVEVYFEEGGKVVKFDERTGKYDDKRKAAVNTAKFLSKLGIGGKYYFFNSYLSKTMKDEDGNALRVYKDSDGNEVEAPNGEYYDSDGSIHIDLNAGDAGQGTALFTLGHELAHFIRDQSKKQFKILGDLVKEAFDKTDLSMHKRVLEKRKFLEDKRGKKVSYDEAYEEVVADAMSTMITDGSFYEKLMEIKVKDKGLFNTIKRFFEKLIAKFKKVYEELTPDQRDAQDIRAMKDMFDRIQTAFVEGLVEASENFQVADGQKNTTEDGGLAEAKDSIRRTQKMTLKDQLSAYYKKQFKRSDAFYFGITPSILSKSGLDAHPLAFAQDDFVKSTRGKHNIPRRVLNKLSEKLQKPIFSFTAGQQAGIVIDDIDGDGKPVVVAIHGGHNMDRKPVNLIKSIYGIDSMKEWVSDQIEGGCKFRVYDIEKANAMLQTEGYLAEVGTQSDGSWDTISKIDPSVKNKSALENSDTSTEALDVEVDAKTESVAPKVLKSERTWTKSDYVQQRDKAAQEIAKAIGVSEKKAKDYIDSVNSIAKMIADDRSRLDYFSSPGRSSFVDNAEYGGSFDFSTLCKKRRLLTGTFTAIQKALPNTALTANEILDIRNRMNEKGLEVSCGLCYVEGSRANMGQFAKEFLRLYKQYYPDAWQPNMADVNTPDGIEWVRINHPECYEQYEYFWNHYGTLKPGDKNLFASQQKPKLYQLHTEYKGEILNKFKNDDKVEDKNLNGGIRLQSFSDFEIVHLIDTMQIIMDMSRVGLAGQAYTKVPDFAWALGDTGLKINLSLIAKGVDENGRLIFDDVEGMPIAEAMKLRDRYSKNVGTILVAFNDEQLMAAMADDRVDFIIPFHRSQWKKSQYEAMGLPAKTKDYTFMQNEKYIKPQYHEYRGRMVKDKATNYMPNEYWDFSKSGKENAEAYLEMCARNNKRPKFYKLLQNNGDGSYSLKADGSTDGYWKLLIDFKMYDNEGNGSPQMAVKPDFNMEEATRMLNDYSGGHSNFPVAQDIVDGFVKDYKKSHKGQQKFSERNSMRNNAPTFYSQMGKVVEGMKQEKFGASSVISMLRGRGVKAEEIRWSGIQAFLDGKKSVTKAELLDFINSSMLQIEEESRVGNEPRDELPTKWHDYKLNGGENYRELVFKMPGSSYSNNAMRTHWGDDAQGVLAHARIQDFNTFIGKMLFIEEIQSDWHNEGRIEGYAESLPPQKEMRLKEIESQEEKLRAERNKIMRDYRSLPSTETSQKHTELRDKYDKLTEQIIKLQDEVFALWGKERTSIFEARPHIHGVPDAPFHDNYHEYVLKILLRMAAEQGYDSIGWTTADIQSDRWSDEYAEGYRIEYDQDIPKFLRKYGKQWDSTVGKTTLDNGTEVWSMAITDSMQKSVLEEGQAMYSERGEGKSNRDLLANAFESLSQNSEEYKMIQEYRGRIRLLNEQEEKLSKLNAEIREIRFTEGKYDAQKLKALEEKAREIAESINRQDKKLLSMEASEPLRKVIAQERKKAAQQTKSHVKEIQQNKKLRAEQTELRHKIRKTVRDLDKILNRGNKKTNVKEDMKGFVSKALELADYLFTDHISNDDLIRKGITVRMTPQEAALVKETEEILSKLYDRADSLTDEEFMKLDAKRKANEDKLRDLLTAQRNERLNTPVYDLFNSLVTEYASLKNSNQDAVRAAYNVDLERLLRQFMGDSADGGDTNRKTLLQNMRVADMTTKELQKLLDAYKMVLTNVRDANKVFVKGKIESIDKAAEKLTGDFSKRKIPDKKLAIIARNIANKIGWDYEKLYYALDRIGSETFTELIMNIADSENIVMQDVMEAAAFRDEMVKTYGFNNWDVNKKIDREFIDNTGKKFNLTLGQAMALYAYSRRDGAWDHIEYGGFVFGEAALTNPRPADSYKLSKAQCEAITDLLTKEQKGYVEAMQKFLSETMGEKGNEVSMLLYGIKMFGEKNYFPIHIAGQYKAQANESQAKAAAGFSTMSNAGFTHAQNPNAKAPFVLEGFNEVWADHVNEMSRYHGTVPALEDLRRVMNRSSYTESGMESMAIKQLMENSYGKEAVEYFDNLYREANSGAITDKLQHKSKKLLSLFRKNSVAYSLSVLVQQPASIVRAYAMIDKKYFGIKGFGTITSGVAKAVSDRWTKAHTNAYNEMLQYAPGVTMAKEIGGFDTATGGSIRSYLLDTNKSLKQKWKTGTALEKGKAALDLVDNNAIANLPNLADKIAWIEIWNACKRETVATHKDLEVNSEEFLQAVGERFTEVIRATQVYDSIFAKSPMLKSKNLAVQYLVSFMNEPNTVANMAESAVRDATRGDWKGGLKKAAVLIHSIIFTNVLKSLIYAMRDDDEEETYIEKYIEAVAGNMMNDFNALNYIPIARDVWSLAQGYDVERADMAIVADAIDALTKVIKNATIDTDDMTEDDLVEFDKKVTEANWKLVESLASFLGIPVKNIRREINGVIDHARIAAANKGLTTKHSAWDKLSDAVIESIPFMSAESKQDKLYEALVAGDKPYVARLKATYKTEDAYHTAVRKALRENDPRIKEAALAGINGNPSERVRIAKLIVKDGFELDDVSLAIQAEINAMEKDENKSQSAKKAKGMYTTDDLVIEFINGDIEAVEEARTDIIATKVTNGDTQEDAEEAFVSGLRTSAKEAFMNGDLDTETAQGILARYGNMSIEEAKNKVKDWQFEVKYGFPYKERASAYMDGTISASQLKSILVSYGGMTSDDAYFQIKAYDWKKQGYGEVTVASVRNYEEYCADAMVPKDVYIHIRSFANNTDNDKDANGKTINYSAMKKIMAEIHAQSGLTPNQKTAIARSLGWAEENINKYKLWK